MNNNNWHKALVAPSPSQIKLFIYLGLFNFTFFKNSHFKNTKLAIKHLIMLSHFRTQHWPQFSEYKLHPSRIDFFFSLWTSQEVPTSHVVALLCLICHSFFLRHNSYFVLESVTTSCLLFNCSFGFRTQNGFGTVDILPVVTTNFNDFIVNMCSMREELYQQYVQLVLLLHKTSIFDANLSVILLLSASGPLQPNTHHIWGDDSTWESAPLSEGEWHQFNNKHLLFISVQIVAH